MYAEIIPDKRTGFLKESFTYKVPVSFDIKIGSLVKVSFGKKIIVGVVTRLMKEIAPVKYEIKEIKEVVPDFNLPESYIEIARWISEYYLCSLGEAIALFLPPEMKIPRKTVAKESMKLNHVKKLSTEQEEIFQKINKKLFAKNKKPALLCGVTGSGKTEIYIKLAEEVIKNNKQVIVLVPEIMLTPQNIERFREVFGDQVALVHSNLSKSERLNAYKDFYFGTKNIIIGPRSALLVPSENIGLIIIDEEHEDAYKQDKSPRYNAITLAEQIAKHDDALLLLGSATPQVETYYKAESGEYDYFEVKNRYHALILPPAEVVDLREEIKKDNFSPISIKLHDEIEKTLKAKRQVLLFLNRRGSSTFVSCRECGEVIECKNCNIPLIHHHSYKGDILYCHHCDYKTLPPTKCPECGSAKIKYFGAGVEKIEQEIIKLFPKARVKRVDAETITNKDDHQKFYDDFKNHKIDVVIGTQMIAKGFDIPGVDLVGIVSADVGLHLPHFRAGEKTFRILTQVSGRSGRRDNSGRTVIQTYWPDSKAVRFASGHDFKGFYEREIKDRQESHYPPFTHIVRVVVEDADEKKAKNSISDIAADLRAENIDLIGPGKCFYQKLRNKYRYHLLIKTEKLPNEKITKIFIKHPYVTWDVDPTELL